MKKFWKWMKEKEYGDWDSPKSSPDNFFVLKDMGGDWVDPFPQMLIGYKIEYLNQYTGLALIDFMSMDIDIIDNYLNQKIRECE
jgi:hypothetical protein